LSRRGRSLAAHASGFDTHRDSITSRFERRDFATSPAFAIAKQCMTAVDTDRLQWALEAWAAAGARWQVAAPQQDNDELWGAAVGSLQPFSCSPKNNVILGAPRRMLPPLDDSAQTPSDRWGCTLLDAVARLGCEPGVSILESVHIDWH
jgi:hypothetical protein